MSKYSLFLTSDIYNVDDFSPAPLALYLNGISITCLQALTYIYFIQNDTVWKLMDFFGQYRCRQKNKMWRVVLSPQIPEDKHNFSSQVKVIQ